MKLAIVITALAAAVVISSCHESRIEAAPAKGSVGYSPQVVSLIGTGDTGALQGYNGASMGIYETGSIGAQIGPEDLRQWTAQKLKGSIAITASATKTLNGPNSRAGDLDLLKGLESGNCINVQGGASQLDNWYECSASVEVCRTGYFYPGNYAEAKVFTARYEKAILDRSKVKATVKELFDQALDDFLRSWKADNHKG